MEIGRKVFFGKNARLFCSLAALWAIIAYAANIQVATLLIFALITAYLIEFYAVRSVFDYFRTGVVQRIHLAIGLAAILGVLVLIWLGMGVLVAMCVVSIFWIDAIALRFR